MNPPSTRPKKNPVIRRVKLLLKYGVNICKETSVSIGIEKITPINIIILISQRIDLEWILHRANSCNDWKNEPEGCRRNAIINTNDIPRYIPRHLEHTGIWLSLR